MQPCQKTNNWIGPYILRMSPTMLCCMVGHSKALKGWKHTKPLKNYNHMYNFFAISFLITYEHHIFILFYFILFILCYSGIQKYSKNIEKCEHMEYIRDKIILITKFENLHIYLKVGVWVEFFGEFFVVNYPNIHALNIRPYRS